MMIDVQLMNIPHFFRPHTVYAVALGQQGRIEKVAETLLAVDKAKPCVSPQ